MIKVGMLENKANEKWIEDFFKSRNIKTENIITDNYKKLQYMLKNEVDIIIDSSYNYKDRNKIYTFSSYPLYIAGNKNSIDIINALDKNEQYFLQYQPIYTPKNKQVIGFEALLRLLDKDNKIIAPFKFIPEIEKKDMLFDISIWVLEKIIKNYNKIQEYRCVKNNDFYISCNISLNEIENDIFV